MKRLGAFIKKHRLWMGGLCCALAAAFALAWAGYTLHQAGKNQCEYQIVHDEYVEKQGLYPSDPAAGLVQQLPAGEGQTLYGVRLMFVTDGRVAQGAFRVALESADGQTLYIVADAVTPSVVYALNTSNGATRWSWTLDAESHSIPAVDNLGQVHVVTASGTYVVLSPEGDVVYSQKLADSFEGSVSIAEWGYAYVLGKDTAAGKLKVYAVALPGVTSAADSSWSQYGGNARHINYQK